MLEVFQCCAEMKDAYLWVSEKSGWAIEVDEKVAAKSLFTDAANAFSGQLLAVTRS